jgi:hypothetical protein
MNIQNSEVEPKPRGRPPGSTRTPPDYLREVWLGFSIEEELIYKRRNRRPSVQEISRMIANAGGLFWGVGGNFEERLDTVLASHPSLRRATIEIVDKRPRVSFCATGRLVVNHCIQSADTLRARYYDAQRLIKTNQGLEEFWTRLLQETLGWEPKLHQVGSGQLKRPRN